MVQYFFHLSSIWAKFKFASIWAKKYVSIKNYQPRAGWARAGGQKTVICPAISAISQDISLKIEI